LTRGDQPVAVKLRPDDVLDFWFSAIDPKLWYAQSDAVDTAIAARFRGLHAMAARCECFAWRVSAHGRLAEIFVLDQFSRNIFRGSARAFAQDPLALALAQEAISRGIDTELPPMQRDFLYMPFMHSEAAAIHEISLSLFAAPGQENGLAYARQHKAIIDRFGRYPHRNDVLGRRSTPDELAFLETPGSGF